nr:uncharacterized protein LOC124816231 [Hydra vulgaris]
MKTQERHFAGTCAEHFIHVAQQWNILNKVSTLSTDCARNIVAAARHLPFERVPCVAHSLQRSVTVSLHNSAFDNALAKCRKVVGHFKHSPASAAELEKKQIELGKKKESLLQEIPTRWNSTLDMIKSVRRNEQPLSDVLTTHNTNVAMLTPAEMDKLQRLEKLLEPCRYILHHTFLTDLIACERIDVSVFVHEPVEAATSKPSKRKFALLVASSETDSEQEEDSIENGVRCYKAEPTISTEACPLQWWSKHAGSHNRLASIAQKYLATPATSVPCEKLFSLAGHNVQKKRVSLSSENVNYLHDYIIKNDKLAYKEQDGISYDVIYCYKTLFAYYFEHDEGRISTESLNDVISIGIRCGSYSFAEIPNNFHYITGVSGTLQTLSKSEKQIIESYGIKKFTYIPSMFGDNKRRFAKEADIFIENTDDYFPKLNEHIEHSSTIKNELRRPVLVFFTTKTSLMEFYNSNKLTLNKEYIQIITEEISESPKEKEMLIKRATVLGQITFLTRAFGRGTDFVCSDQNVIVNGGVHVIQTFFSEELSEEVQIQGRTARQGKDGSCSMVLRDSDLEKYLGVDYLNIIYKLRNEKVFYDTLNSKRNQLYDSTYLNISVLVKEAKKEHLLEENFVKNLNNNKIDEIKAFLGERNIGSTNTVITSRTICLIDATGSMGDLLNKAKVTVGTMFERAAAILNENSIAADSFQMQFAVYRDYDCLSDGILQYSPWETKPENLRLFMDKISAYGGGDYEEAIEIGLWHVDRENKESAVNQVILIGDAPAKSKTQINEYQNVKGEIYWQKTDFKVPTFYKIEVEKLKKIGIVVHTFYLHDGAKSNFQEIAKETGGLCEPLNIDSLDGANTLTDIVTRRILGNVGQLSGKGNELVNAYNKRFVKSYK